MSANAGRRGNGCKTLVAVVFCCLVIHLIIVYIVVRQDIQYVNKTEKAHQAPAVALRQKYKYVRLEIMW